jgi:uncharacterized protein (TIGR03083 family)
MTSDERTGGTTATARPVGAGRPRRSALDRPTAMRLAATEYRRYGDALADLDPVDWSAPTDCPGWDVRAMAAHNLGMARMAASFAEMIRQQIKAERRARTTGEETVDALTAIQVAERSRLTPAEIVADYRRTGQRAASGRRRRPGWFRNARLPGAQRVNGVEEPWTFGFLIDTIRTRDCWMHRVDTGRATGRDLVLTPDHDGTIVADVVREWSARSRPTGSLVLTGPAGGAWAFTETGGTITMDAVEVCRVLSGRPPTLEAQAQLLQGTEVPF